MWSKFASFLYYLRDGVGERVANARAVIATIQPGRIDIGRAASIGPRAIIRVHRDGQLEIGRNFRCDRDVEIVVYGGASLIMGNDVYIGHGSTIACAHRIEVGSGTSIADMVSIRDVNHYEYLRSSDVAVERARAYVVVGERCWIGSKATLVAGASVGDDSVVGANAVVTQVFAGGVRLVGVPARNTRVTDVQLD